MSDNDFKWYILQAYAGYENRVKKLIEEQIQLQGKEEFIKEIFIPAEAVTTKKAGKERTTNVTYFPGYILINMQLTPELWHLLKDVPRVSGFVGGTTEEPLPITQKELDSIREQIESGKKQAEVNSTFSVGQSVQVIEGPFAEFNGVIETVDPERNKLTVTVSIFGRSTPLELDFDKVKANE